MTRPIIAAMLMAGLLFTVLDVARARAQEAPDLSGRWTLNRDLSEFPREIGFHVDWASTRGPGADSMEGAERGAPAAAPGLFSTRPESEDDARRKLQLTAEVRNPSTHLTIVDTPAAVTITSDHGQSRTFHPTGRNETLQLDGVPVVVVAKREAGRLEVLYKVAPGRDLRYTYSRVDSPPQVIIDVQFVERGGGDHVKRVYEAAVATEAQTDAGAVPAAASPSAPPSGPAEAVAPASGQRTPDQAFDQRPDAALRGLTRLGVVVEGLNPQAATCGLSQAALEAAVSKRLSDAGFSVRRNADEDTYVYVNVMTASLATGLCVSRYDAFLYTHTTATLSYQDRPVLVEVALLHKGGITGGPSAAHGEAVLRGVQDYVEGFATRIHDASK